MVTIRQIIKIIHGVMHIKQEPFQSGNTKHWANKKW